MANSNKYYEKNEAQEENRKYWIKQRQMGS